MSQSASHTHVSEAPDILAPPITLAKRMSIYMENVLMDS
jgi:hypothetical protein